MKWGVNIGIVKIKFSFLFFPFQIYTYIYIFHLEKCYEQMLKTHLFYDNNSNSFWLTNLALLFTCFMVHIIHINLIYFYILFKQFHITSTSIWLVFQNKILFTTNFRNPQYFEWVFFFNFRNISMIFSQYFCNLFEI